MIIKLKEEVETLIKNALKFSFNLHIYGSYASGLSLPTSDVDFLIEFESNIEGRYLFEELEQVFKQSQKFQEVKYIKTASIPVMKLSKRIDFKIFKIDITIKDPNHYGLNCVDFVQA